jgi:hypothetical protein
MHRFCHSCGGDLAAGEGSAFCPNCGAPQIYLQDHGEPVAGEGVDTTGAVPPPRPQTVDWKTAIRCAGFVAVVSAVLTLVSQRVQVLSLLSLLWTVSGSMIALALYQKQRPLAWMDAGVGARIGVVVGFALVAFLGVAIAAGGLVARYGLHDMGATDAQMTQQLQQVHAQLEKTSAANPDVTISLGFVQTPEFRAGMMLCGFGLLAGFLLVLSTVGGALGGLMRTRRNVSV